MAECDITPPTPADTTDSVVYKEFYATAGWQKGLTTASEVWVNGTRKKWINTAWTQDDTTANYPTNPRVTDSTINDVNSGNGNHRRSTTSYYTFTLPDGASCSLPQEVAEYDAATTTMLRTTRTEYNLSSDYLSRRIIGLPSYQYLYEDSSASGILRSKVGYVYDDNTLVNYLQALPSSATQHDSTNYSTSLRWRGNTNRVRRYELNTTSGAATGNYTETQAGYNITGMPAFETDAVGHQVTTSYSDSFYQNVNRSSPSLQTFAYPTSASIQEQNPPATITSSMQYNYDMGAVIQETDPNNAILHTLYDAAGRSVRVTRRDGVNNVDAGYTKLVYSSSMEMVQSYTLMDIAKPEAYAAQVLDGAGRVRATAADHPSSLGHYTGQIINYDSLGRVASQSNPTETTASGNPWPYLGDDDPNNGGYGWIYSHQTYDWKGRPLVATNDADTASRTISYDGCGCAGGEVTTLTDEVGNRQRVTTDIFGRTNMVEDLNTDGSVYRTTTSIYNVRDQITQVTTRVGSNGTAQTATTEYDGYGRLSKNTLPEAAAATTFSYYDNDLPNVKTDARGATTTYTYNNRGLVQGITYALSGDVTNVTYGYDAAGNRTSMTDASGNSSYVYDTLSQLRSETRYFNETGRSFTTSYDYYTAGALKSITDQFSTAVTYTRNQTGSVTDVPGYATGISYRAWGSIKGQSLANGRNLSILFDGRMRAKRFDMPGITGWQYQYSGDGRLAFASNLQTLGVRDQRLDRKLMYDQVGRLSFATSGSDARGEAGASTGPYRQNFNHDVWDNLTFRDNLRGNIYNSYSALYTNNHNQNTGWLYDQNGSLTQTSEAGSTTHYTYNSAMQLTTTVMSSSSSTTNFTFGYDGDGRQTKKVETNAPTTYYVRSSVLNGQVIDEVDSSGNKLRGYIYQEGSLIAKQEGGQTQWDVRDPANFSDFMLNSSGAVTSHVELDPLGTAVDLNNSSYTQNPIGFYGNPNMQGSYCRVHSLGVSVPCDLAEMLNGSDFGVTVTVNGDEMPVAAATGMAEIGYMGITQQDIVFGNPWDLDNILPRMSFMGGDAAPGTIDASGPYTKPSGGGRSGSSGNNFFFNWAAFYQGYLWMPAQSWRGRMAIGLQWERLLTYLTSSLKRNTD